jgi:hypothetical protein
MDPTIAVVYRGDPPFRAEIVEDIDRYEFVQPHLTILCGTTSPLAPWRGPWTPYAVRLAAS